MGVNGAIAVAGNGSTTLVVASCLASLGHSVLGVRSSRSMPDSATPVEPELGALLLREQRAGRLTLSSDLSAAVRAADVTFLCIDDQPDPFEPHRAESVAGAVHSIAEAAKPGHPIVVVTTVPMGDGTPLRSTLDGALEGNGNRPSLVSHLGFMRGGRAVADFLNPAQVVIGSDDPAALDRVTDLLTPILDQSHAAGDPKRKPEVIRTDFETAEAIRRAVDDAVARAATDGTPEPGNREHRLIAAERIGGGVAASHLKGAAESVVPQWKRPRYQRGRTATPTVSVVIPTLNEAENLPHVLSRLPRSVDEVVIVDGRSTDGTVSTARRLRPDCVVVLDERPGKGFALRSGFEAATGDVVVMLDADGSTDPLEIPAFVGMLVAGADFVKGSRFLQGGGTDDMERHRKFGNRILTILVNIAFGGRYSDLCYGYNAMWRDAIPAMDLNAEGFEIETLMGIRALRAGLEIAEVPSFECPRIHGSSNLRAIRDGFRILRTIIRERFRPFRPPAHTTIGAKEVASDDQPAEIDLTADLMRIN